MNRNIYLSFINLIIIFLIIIIGNPLLIKLLIVLTIIKIIINKYKFKYFIFVLPVAIGLFISTFILKLFVEQDLQVALNISLFYLLKYFIVVINSLIITSKYQRDDLILAISFSSESRYEKLMILSTLITSIKSFIKYYFSIYSKKMSEIKNLLKLLLKLKNDYIYEFLEINYLLKKKKDRIEIINVIEIIYLFVIILYFFSFL